jgi:nuclear cap-binding protein subunit 1
VIDRIHSTALDQSIDPLVSSTDVFMTTVCWVGSKSLSHVLACIERTKDRLLDAGAASEAARAQIITAVVNYWSAHPGVAISIIEKLLNYSIVTPGAVVDWALVGDRAGPYGQALSKAWVFELVFHTVVKVTMRLRQVVKDGVSEGLQEEIATMRELFRAMDDALVSWAQGTKDQMMDPSVSDGGEDLVKRWGERWLRVFRRRAAIEEAFLAENLITL